MQNLKQNVKAGFSLIEVMVATVILLIIVLMIGSVFRQGTSTWDSGYARAEGGMIVRAVIGSIQRELSTAIDGRLFPGPSAWTDADNPITVNPNAVKFICMKESEGGGTSPLQREPWLVEYTWGSKEMKRKAWPLTYSDNSGTWSQGTLVDSIVYSEDFQEDKKAIYSANFTFETFSNVAGVRPGESQAFEEDYFWNIPYVSIKVELTRASNFSGLEIRSWGPDGKEGTSDDILVK